MQVKPIWLGTAAVHTTTITEFSERKTSSKEYSNNKRPATLMTGEKLHIQYSRQTPAAWQHSTQKPKVVIPVSKNLVESSLKEWCVTSCRQKWTPTYNSFVFGGFVGVVVLKTFCDMVPQTSWLHRVLQVDGTNTFLVNRQLWCVHCYCLTLLQTHDGQGTNSNYSLHTFYDKVLIRLTSIISYHITKFAMAPIHQSSAAPYIMYVTQ